MGDIVVEMTSEDAGRLVAKLCRRIKNLEKALAEAMEWNWLDEDAEEAIPKWIEETLQSGE